jgi:hypothetical protein
MGGAWRRVALAGAAVLSLALIGCGAEHEPRVTSAMASVQLNVAVKAVQSATGADWEQMTEIGPIGCSPGLEQMAVSWKATATVDRDEAYKAVREALEDVGFETRILGPDSRTPTVASQTGDGFGLDFAYPIEGGPLYLHAGSDCFPLEEWPDEEG